MFFLLFFLSSICCYSQFRDYNNTIGFTCGGAGEATPIVSRIHDLLIEKKYKNFVSMLYSNNSAENFLAVIICEKLKEKKLITLNEKDSNRISKLYKSNKGVEVCGGCTFMGFVKLSVLLKK